MCPRHRGPVLASAVARALATGIVGWALLSGETAAASFKILDDDVFDLNLGTNNI